MRFLFVMDPAATMSPDKDTTFAFMRGALARGHDCLHCLPRDLSNLGRDVFARARPIRVMAEPPHTQLGVDELFELAALDAVFIRKDPPFDSSYLHLTQQLELCKDRVLVLNDPRGIRDANEKLFAFEFADLMPRSLVSSRRDEILDFVQTVGGTAVLKPLDGAGGAGVVVLSATDRNSRSLVDMLTREGTELALVQEYQPEVRAGDKRVLLLDGEPLGAILRIPREDDVRANIHAGGQVVPTELTARERAIVIAMADGLRARGLWFVGLDLIGEKLIEVNVTSPTGIQELARFTNQKPEERVIAWAETHTKHRG
ncbi:MAG TPA: glutathione synthase [Polyangiaceae bacterium]